MMVNLNFSLCGIYCQEEASKHRTRSAVVFEMSKLAEWAAGYRSAWPRPPHHIRTQEVDTLAAEQRSTFAMMWTTAIASHGMFPADRSHSPSLQRLVLEMTWSLVLPF